MNDPKQQGIRAHAFEALSDFSERLRTSRRAVADGWFYEDTSRGLIAAASGALPFLDAGIRAELEEAVRAADGLRVLHEKGLVSDYGEREAVVAVALLIVEATYGLPGKKLKEEPPAAPPPTPASTDDTIPF